MEGDLPELAERFESIRVFLGECARLKDDAWLMPAARLFLATRPPSYFDVARRLMYAAESEGGFSADVFDRLLSVVNALRGTRYYDSVGRVLDPHTLAIPWTVSDRWGRTVVASDQNPSLVLGNLVVPDAYWRLAAERTARFPRGRPVHTVQRLLGLMRVIARANHVAKPRRGSGHGGTPTLLVLPELTVPRRWFRAVATHVVRHGGFGAVMGLEYLHDPSGRSCSTKRSPCSPARSVPSLPGRGRSAGRPMAKGKSWRALLPLCGSGLVRAHARLQCRAHVALQQRRA